MVNMSALSACSHWLARGKANPLGLPLTACPLGPPSCPGLPAGLPWQPGHGPTECPLSPRELPRSLRAGFVFDPITLLFSCPSFHLLPPPPSNTHPAQPSALPFSPSTQLKTQQLHLSPLSTLLGLRAHGSTVPASRISAPPMGCRPRPLSSDRPEFEFCLCRLLARLSLP